MMFRTIFLFLPILVLGNACLFDSPSQKPSVGLPPQVKPEYEGGLFRVIGTFPEGASESDVVWRIGSSEINRHAYTRINNGLVQTDTAYLEWKKAPPPRIDTIPAAKEGAKPTLDTTYLDTISLSVGGVEANSLVIKINNLLPKIDTVDINGLKQKPETDLIVLAAHRGEPLNFSYKISDPFNKAYGPQISFPENAGIQRMSRTDSVWYFQWAAPDSLMEDTILMRMADTRGLGYKDIKVRRFTYNESGAVWVGTGDRVSKWTEKGQPIYQSERTYGSIADIAVHPTRSAVWVADAGKHRLARLDWDGRLKKSDSGFIQPQTLAVDVVSNLLWVGDQDLTVKGRLRSYDVSNADSLKKFADVDANLVGPIGDVSIDQYDASLTWYTVPERDLVIKVRNGVKDTISFQFADSQQVQLNRPSFAAYDARTSRIWVSDSTSLVMADTSGTVLARIYGFEFIGGVAAAKGTVCVVDSRQNRMYRFGTSLSGKQLDAESDGYYLAGFGKPVSVDISLSDASCWVADRDAGTIVRVSAQGAILLRQPGFALPTVIRVHKGVE